MRFAAVNLGCKVNHVELEEFSAAALDLGHEPTAPEDADFILINTCTVTGEAERKTRKAVNRALAANDSAKVLLTGCSVAINPDAYRALDPRIEVLSKPEVAVYLEEHFPAAGSAHEAAVAGGTLFRTRSGVKIQDGCDNACTFCIVHTARGRSRSMPRERILSEVSALIDAGTREIVLTGINLGSWADAKGRLASLLEEMLRIAEAAGHASDVRFRLSSIEPTDIDEDVIALLAASDGRICRHLHIPLQSGSSEVLAAMDRRYDAPYFAELVARLRTAIPALSLTTDAIVGFPGETEAQFEETCALCRTAAFSKIHVFPYSRREGTPAAARPGQVLPEVKNDRARRLRTLSDELRAEDFARRVGSVEGVLVEGKGFGMTESYHKVPVPAGATTGEVVRLALGVVE